VSRRLVRALLCVGLCATGARDVRGDTRADALFAQGKQQLADKHYAEACTTFEQVDAIEPGIGAKLNVARCYEEWGKLAKAYRWYSNAEEMARTTSDERAAKIKELTDALDAQVPRLTINLAPGADAKAAAIKLDGQPFAIDLVGKEQRVDPGPHLIEFQAGTERKTKTIPIERGGSSEVLLDGPRGLQRPAVVVEPPPVVPVTNPGRKRRLIGLAVGGAGVVALGIAGGLTISARGTYNDALDDHCMGTKNLCDETGVRLTRDARSRANKATVVAIFGGLAVAGGAVLFLTAPKHHAAERTVYLAPVVGSDGGGLVVGGGF
jgi:hypothetical protein